MSPGRKATGQPPSLSLNSYNKLLQVVELAEMIEVKLRPVGNALGLILPGKMVKKDKLQAGQTVLISVFPPKKVNWDRLLGLTKGASTFERDRTERKL